MPRFLASLRTGELPHISFGIMKNLFRQNHQAAGIPDSYSA
jgi:hypothetical protein